MSNKNEKPKPTRLLGSAPSSVYERLIVSYPNQTTSDFALFYQEAALRLADTYQGKPQDDMILHPFLYLYRQAVELQLKNTVSFLARTRMRYVDGKTDELQQLNNDAYLKRTYGHNMYRLLNEVKKQYAALQMEEPFPKSLENFISMFHEADSAGMAFRYAGLLPNVQENVDFPDLVQLLNEGYATLCRVGDDVDFTFSPSPTLDDLTSDYS